MDFIARPFGMLLMFLYELVKNYGWAVILFAVVVKVILLPFQMKSKRGMMKTSRLQPKLAELQKKHGANKAKLNEETQKLYKQEGVNPASGCLWGFLPLPILLALFGAVRQPLTMMMGVAKEQLAAGGDLLNQLQKFCLTSSGTGTYQQIDQAQAISKNWSLFEGLKIENLKPMNFNFLGLNLGLQPQWNFLWNNRLHLYGGSWIAGFILFLIPIISGALQFFASRLSQKMNPMEAQQQGQGGSMKTMMMIMPLFSVYIGFVTPAALGLYWSIGTILQIAQDIWLTKRYTRIIDAEEAVKNEQRILKEAELEAKRIEAERRKAEGIADRNPNKSKRKKHMSNKQGQIEKAAEWQKKNTPLLAKTTENPSRVGDRPYARGRAYDPDRYANAATGDADEPKPKDTEDIADDEPENEPVNKLADEIDDEPDDNDSDEIDEDEYEDEDEDEDDEEEV